MDDLAQLLTAAQAGDEGAFEALARSQGDRLFSIAYRVTGDSSTAEDVVQEAFLRVLKSHTPLRQEGAAHAWLARVATRLALDAVRRQNARRRLEGRRAMMLKGREETAPDPLLSSEESRTLSEAFSRLPGEIRALLWLSVVEGQGLREVAKCLGMTRSTAGRRVQWGLARLRQALKGAALTVPFAAFIGQALRNLPRPAPSPEFLARVEAIGLSLRGGGRNRGGKDDARGSDAEPTRGSGGSRLAKHKISIAAAVILAALGTAIWLLDPFGRGVKRLEGPSKVAQDVPIALPAATKPIEVPTPKAVVAEVRPGARIEGHVIDEAEQGVAAAPVWAYENITRGDPREMMLKWTFIDLLAKVLAGQEPLATTRTDDDGSFKLELPDERDDVILVSQSPGPSPEMTGSATGPEPQERRLLAPGEAQTAEIVLMRGERISGKVTDTDGAALEGVSVVLVPWPRPFEGSDFTTTHFEVVRSSYIPRRWLTGKDGRFEFSGLPRPRSYVYTLLAQKEGWASGYVTGIHDLPAEETDLVLEHAVKMPGKVFRSNLESPVAGVKVVALPEPPGDSGWFAMTQSDEKGEFSVDCTTGGEFKLLAKATGHVFPRRLFIQPSEVELPIMVDLALGGVLHGTVRYEDTGRPARRIAILCRNWAGAHLSAETLTDEEGHYRLEGVSFSTRSQIVVSSPGYVQKDFRQKAPTAEQLEVELDIDLIPTAAFRGQVLGPGGGPAKGVMVEAFAVVESPPESTALRWRREALRQSPLLTDEGGRFALEDIPPHGKLFIWAYHPDLGEAILGPEAWPLPAPEPPSDLRIELSGGAGLRVKVVDMQGNPIDGAVVLPAMVEFPDLEPRGMSTLMFFSQRTSLDVMRAEQRSGIWPGSRVGHAGSDGVCEWKDLVPGKCRVSVTTPSGDGAAGGYWIYTAKTAEALSPGATLSVSVALDLTHQLKGKVTNARGKGLPSLLVCAYCPLAPTDGLRDFLFHAVIGTSDDGSFLLDEIGPGPYRIEVGTKERRLFQQEGVSGQGDVRIVMPNADLDPKESK